MTTRENNIARQRGKSFPIEKGSKVKLRSIAVIRCNATTGIWHVLENGTRVYVLFKNNEPIMWIKPKLASPTGGGKDGTNQD